jgi:hypothetical protein
VAHFPRRTASDRGRAPRRASVTIAAERIDDLLRFQQGIVAHRVKIDRTVPERCDSGGCLLKRCGEGIRHVTSLKL